MEQVYDPAHSPTTTKNRVLGCLFGGALGDAWGGPYEGVADLVVFEVPLRPALSDDTQLTLATCQSIIDSGGVYPENLASQFSRWFLAGRVRGVGSSTLKAMRDLAVGTHWALAGARGEFAAGNGAAMCCATSVSVGSHLPAGSHYRPRCRGSLTERRGVCRRPRRNVRHSLRAFGNVVIGPELFGGYR